MVIVDLQPRLRCGGFELQYIGKKGLAATLRDETGRYPTGVFESFRDHVYGNGMLHPDSNVVVGFSGGPDSTCLLHLLVQLGVSVSGAHLNHLQRPESDADADHCRAVCESWGIGFVLGRADVPAIAKERNWGLEEAGRNARYEFLTQAKAQTGADLIVTAHTRSDCVESVILNLVRGCGLSGAQGIPECNGDVVRPLLPFSRTEVEDYCFTHGLATLHDSGNDDPAFTRVKIRQQVIPILQTLNPRAEEAIWRFSRIANDEDRFLDSAAAAALEGAETPINGPYSFLTSHLEVVFDRKRLAHLPTPLLARAVRLAVLAMGSTLDSRQTGIVVQGLRSEVPGSVTSEGGLVSVSWAEDSATFQTQRNASLGSIAMEIPGETHSREFGWSIRSDLAQTPSFELKRESFEVHLPRTSIVAPLHVRSAAEGDRIEPLGFPHQRLISDLLSEAKLTPKARKAVPVVCDMAGPLWIPGICLSNRVQSNEIGGDSLHMVFEPLRS